MKGSWQMEAFVFPEMPGRHREGQRKGAAGINLPKAVLAPGAVYMG